MTEQKTIASDRQVGDGIINGYDGSLMVVEKKSNDGWFCDNVRTNKRTLISKNDMDNFYNIDAAIRAKDAEIEVLKAQIKDPWCYDISKAPKDGEEFIGWTDNDWLVVHYKDGDWVNDIDAYDLEAWMPIPKPKGETT